MNIFSLLRCRIACICALLNLAPNVTSAEPERPEPANVDLAAYQVEPTGDDPAEIKLGLEAIDHEIARLQAVNEKRRGMAREESNQKLAQIEKLRREVGANFTKAGWDRLLQAVFLAMEANRLTEAKFDDASLWNLSRNSAFVEAGRATVMELCVPCHLPDLKGQSAKGFGPDLTDHVWLHGGRPSEILAFVTKGAFDRGMPPWGSIIGAKKVLEVTAYVLSKHQEGEPIQEYGTLPAVAE